MLLYRRVIEFPPSWKSIFSTLKLSIWIEQDDFELDTLHGSWCLSIFLSPTVKKMSCIDACHHVAWLVYGCPLSNYQNTEVPQFR